MKKLKINEDKQDSLVVFKIAAYDIGEVCEDKYGPEQTAKRCLLLAVDEIIKLREQNEKLEKTLGQETENIRKKKNRIHHLEERLAKIQQKNNK